VTPPYNAPLPGPADRPAGRGWALTAECAPALRCGKKFKKGRDAEDQIVPPPPRQPQACSGAIFAGRNAEHTCEVACEVARIHPNGRSNFFDRQQRVSQEMPRKGKPHLPGVSRDAPARVLFEEVTQPRLGKAHSSRELSRRPVTQHLFEFRNGLHNTRIRWPDGAQVAHRLRNSRWLPL